MGALGADFCSDSRRSPQWHSGGIGGLLWPGRSHVRYAMATCSSEPEAKPPHVNPWRRAAASAELETEPPHASRQRPRKRGPFAPLGGGNGHGRVDAAAVPDVHCRLPKGSWPLLIASEQASQSLPALEALVLEPGVPQALSLRSRGNHSRS